jgi:hypothetical protein
VAAAADAMRLRAHNKKFIYTAIKIQNSELQTIF